MGAPERLYSRGFKNVEHIDAVPDNQRIIHAELEAWARWCREKWQPKTCESVEGKFDPGEGGRHSRAATIALPENPRLRAIDGVIRHMRAFSMPAHGEALRLYYCGQPPRYRAVPWWIICRVVHVPKAAFPGFMVTARAAVNNMLSRKGIDTQSLVV